MTDRIISPRARRVWHPLIIAALLALFSMPSLALAQAKAPASSSSSAQAAQQARERQQMMQRMRQQMHARMQALIKRVNEPGVRNFRLDNDFLNKFVAVAKDARNMKNKPHIDANGATTTDQLAAKLDANSGIHKVLARHGLTAKRYVKGSMALTAVMMKARLSKRPAAAAFAKRIHVSSHNTHFYQKNQTHIEAMMKSLRPSAASSKH